MKIVGYALLRGVILATILTTGSGSISKFRNLTHREYWQTLELRSTKSESLYTKVYLPFINCVKPSHITTGERCRDLGDIVWPEYESRILKNIIKSGISEDEYNKMEYPAKGLIYAENIMVEDYLWRNTQICFHEYYCKNGVCICARGFPDYNQCLGHKQKEVFCTTQAVIWLRNIVAYERTNYLFHSDCGKKSMAGVGEECRHNFYNMDTKETYRHMNEEDWKNKIKLTCIKEIDCVKGICQCPDGGTKCNSHKRKDLDDKCKDQIKKTVRDYKELSELISSKEKHNPPTAKPPTGNPPKAKPPSAKPPTGNPPKAKPPSAKPPTGNPPKAKPPSAKPPTGNPPKAKPPSAKPPSAKPPHAAKSSALMSCITTAIAILLGTLIS